MQSSRLDRFFMALHYFLLGFYSVLLLLGIALVVFDSGLWPVFFLAAVPSILGVVGLLRMATEFRFDDEGRVEFIIALKTVKTHVGRFLEARFKEAGVPCGRIVLRTMDGTILLRDQGYAPHSIDEFLFDARKANKEFRYIGERRR